MAKKKVVYEVVDEGDEFDLSANHWFREKTVTKAKKMISKVPKFYLPVVVRKVTIEVVK